MGNSYRLVPGVAEACEKILKYSEMILKELLKRGSSEK